MRLAVSSRLLRAGCAAVTLGVGVACGGGAAPQPTSAPTNTLPVAPVASPQRAQLASPVPSSAPTAGPTAAATTSSAQGQTYEVQPGDTLLSIAEKVYGDATKWRQIYDANKDVIGPDPDKLKVEMKLTIPPKES